MKTAELEQVCIILKLGLTYPRANVPADKDLIANICESLDKVGMEPHDVMVLSHEISNGNAPVGGAKS